MNEKELTDLATLVYYRNEVLKALETTLNPTMDFEDSRLQFHLSTPPIYHPEMVMEFRGIHRDKDLRDLIDIVVSMGEGQENQKKSRRTFENA